MFDCKTVSTPMDYNYGCLPKEKCDYGCLLQEKCEYPHMENQCRKLKGNIMYAMLESRPDFCNCISILCRYQNYASVDLLL